jgi:C4-type Zn-finger protein
MCNHEDFKIAERLFNKFGKPVATVIYCLKCGAKEKIIIPKKEQEQRSLETALKNEELLKILKSREINKKN